MRTTKFTLYVNNSEGTDIIEQVINKVQMQGNKEMKYKIIKDKESDGMYINIMKDPTQPSFMFKDTIFETVNELKRLLEQKTVLTFDDPSNSINNISETFMEFVNENAAYYNK